MVLRTHKEALYAIRAFWAALQHSRVTFVTLSRALRRIDIAVKGAERAYRSVMQRHSNSAKIVRLYAKFLE